MAETSRLRVAEDPRQQNGGAFLDKQLQSAPAQRVLFVGASVGIVSLIAGLKLTVLVHARVDPECWKGLSKVNLRVRAIVIKSHLRLQ